MGKNATSKLVRHLVEGGGTEIVGRYERKDGRASVGGTVHVANVNFVERRFPYTKYQRTSFFKANVGGALNQAGSDAVRNTGQSSDTARNDDHRIGRIGTTGNVCANISVRLLVNFAGGATEKLARQIAAAAKTEFLRDDAKRAIGGDEVHGFNAQIALKRLQQVTRKQGAAGAGCRDDQVLRCVRQFDSEGPRRSEF